MGKYVIINADDFGFSSAYNYGVMEGVRNGIVSSVSLMANMHAAAHAVRLAGEFPDLCLSLHINLVQGYCCADSKTIPGLVREDGSFYPSRMYAPDGILKHSGGNRLPDKEEVKRECEAQLERFHELTGRYPVHIEGHSILHPSVIQAFSEIAAERGMHYMCMDGRPQSGFLDVSEAFEAPIAGLWTEYSKTGLTMPMMKKILSYYAGNDHSVNVLHSHPGYVDAYIMDNSSLVLPRCRDLQTLCDPEIRAHLHTVGLILTDFDHVQAK
jgi:predicted glycoside hydrolase/deacetylase ChbG (UPF0249 family)